MYWRYGGKYENTIYFFISLTWWLTLISAVLVPYVITEVARTKSITTFLKLSTAWSGKYLWSDKTRANAKAKVPITVFENLLSIFSISLVCWGRICLFWIRKVRSLSYNIFYLPRTAIWIELNFLRKLFPKSSPYIDLIYI